MTGSGKLASISPFAVAAALEREGQAHADLLRDIVGPLPFRPVAIDPSWLAGIGGAVVRLARGIYERNDFDSLPVLALNAAHDGLLAMLKVSAEDSGSAAVGVKL